MGLAPMDDQIHFGLQCTEFDQIRGQYIRKFIDICPNLTKHVSDLRLLLLIFLDPYSPFVPSDVHHNKITSSQNDITDAPCL